MRQLGCDQSLLLTAMPDIHDKLAKRNNVWSKNIDMKTILVWVMQNTIEASRTGLLEFAMNGAHFCETYKNPEKVFIDEKTELDSFYGQVQTKQDLGQVITEKMKGVHTRKELTDYVSKIGELGEKFGRGQEVFCSLLDEECERELEREEEQEEEEENEVPREVPHQERDWDFAKFLVLSNQRSHMQAMGSKAYDLSAAVETFLLPKKLTSISWDGGKDQLPVLLTRNFLRTLKSSKQLSRYLRQVDPFVVLQDGEILIISDREADELLEWEFNNKLDTSRLKSYASKHKDVWSKLRTKFNNMLGRIQLFNGETMFGSNARRLEIKKLLPTREARDAAIEMIGIRGLDRFLQGSDLAEICREE